MADYAELERIYNNTPSGSREEIDAIKALADAYRTEYGPADQDYRNWMIRYWEKLPTGSYEEKYAARDIAESCRMAWGESDSDYLMWKERADV